ncbi:MAG: hypothetical protein LOD91_07455 [Limnochordales bacterium]|nr:FUN14 domain-containing protein [Limnochordales bacterium]
MPAEINWPVLGGQLALGTLLGVAVGFTVKKALKVGLVLAGVLVLTALALQHFNFITIHWSNLESLYTRAMEETGGLLAILKGWAAHLESLIPVAGSFVVGFFLGLRAG